MEPSIFFCPHYFFSLSHIKMSEEEKKKRQRRNVIIFVAGAYIALSILAVFSMRARNHYSFANCSIPWLMFAFLFPWIYLPFISWDCRHQYRRTVVKIGADKLATRIDPATGQVFADRFNLFRCMFPDPKAKDLTSAAVYRLVA